MKQFPEYKKNIIITALLIIVIGFIEYIFFDLNKINLTVPIENTGDAIGFQLFTKEIIDGDGFGTFCVRNFPKFKVTNYFYDGPLHYLVVYVIAEITKNVGLTINVYFLLTYILVAICSYYSLLKINISKRTAFAIAIVYAFIPGHTFRGYGHLCLGSCYILPLACLVPLWIMNGGFLTEEKKEKGNISIFKIIDYNKIIEGTIYLFLLALLSAYYGFFAIIIIMTVGGITAVDKKSVCSIIISLYYSFVIILVYGVLLLPSILQRSNVIASSSVIRSYSDVEVYGLKLVQLILPIESHRISAFAYINKMYSSLAPNVNENSWSSLGIVLSIGLIIGIIVCFIKIDTVELKNYAKLNLICILIATIGGGSAIIMMLYKGIRCYNRFSFIIGIYSSFIIAFIIDKKLKNIKNISVKGVFLVGIILLSAFDQTPSDSFGNTAADRDNLFFEQEAFVTDIENREGNGANIVVLPIVDADVNGYKQSFLYMHSDTLNWGNIFRNTLTQKLQYQCLEKQIFEYVMLGADGFVLCKDSCIVDDFSNVKAEMDEILGNVDIVSTQSNWYYYDADEYFNAIKENMDEVTIEKYKNLAQDYIHPLYHLGEELEFTTENSSGMVYSNYGMANCEENGTWTIGNETSFSFKVVDDDLECVKGKVKVTIDVESVFRGKQTIVIYSNGNSVFEGTLDDNDYQIQFEIDTSAAQSIDFVINLPNAIEPYKISDSDDTRKLGIMIRKISII
ncbi:MAG: hypothetical protein K5754_10070 [Butyrivibrio sp.]|jgi:phosphoglycerol transferase|nr:hypothetical protein [Butyrivibrio sp.]